MSWRTSLKTFVGLPSGTPNIVLSTLFEDSLTTAHTIHDRNLSKVNSRFGFMLPTEQLELQELKNLGLIPNNFPRLFNFAKHRCTCHNNHLSIDLLLDHCNTSLNDLLNRLTGSNNMNSNTHNN